MTPSKGASELVTVAGRTLKLTSLDKVLYPETGTTKAEVIEYYSRIAPVLIPHARDRPLTRKRWVHGVGTAHAPGQVFFQKNLDASAPSWVQRRTLQHSDHENTYPLVNDVATLTWLAQISSLELHVPQWRFDAQGRMSNPDRMVLDLDPGEGVGLRECAEVARLARAIMTGMGLDPLPLTSGSKGIHLYARLDGGQTSQQVSDVARELARSLEADHPDLVVSDMKKALRRGKVLVDWSQNNSSKTTVAPYSLRGRAHPLVAAPRSWRELSSPSLAQLDYHQVLRRVKQKGDLLADLDPGQEADPDPDPQKTRDRLELYRSKRDASVTPEPMGGSSTGGNSFVIQRHQARRLHYDFRLERDGVLVSWALPKGVPTTGARNHLAVQTEDHPLDYGAFEGEIPRGEYGAGTVEIWDAGHYELEKWRDGKEVIATLHGRAGGGLGGSKRFALIRTGKGDEPNWLIHLMELEGAGRGGSATRARDERRTTANATTDDRIAPMLASAGDLHDVDGDEWSFEMKWDGIRAIATVDEGATRLFSRNGNELTVTYPEIADELARRVKPDSAVLDGELVALDRAGRPSFSRLQQRMGLTRESDVERAIRLTPVQFMLFDLLRFEGSDLRDKSYDERRAALVEAVDEGGLIHVPPALAGDAEEALVTSGELGLEGIIAKDRHGRYRSGKRSGTWVKIKHFKTQEVVVAGWKPGKGRRSDTLGSLLLAIPDGDELRYAGKVGTGFGDAELTAITSRLRGMSRMTSPVADVPRIDAADANWVTPKLVGEVEFSEWTPTGRLRQPSWRGWRPDKSPADVRREH